MDEPPDAATDAAASFDPHRRRRGGRPSLPKAERRSHHVGFYVTLAELARLEALTEGTGADCLSDYVRTTSLSERGAAPRRRQRGPDFGPIVVEFSAVGNNLNQLTRLAHSGQFSAATEAAIRECLQAHGAVLRRLFSDDCPA